MQVYLKNQTLKNIHICLIGRGIVYEGEYYRKIYFFPYKNLYFRGDIFEKRLIYSSMSIIKTHDVAEKYFSIVRIHQIYQAPLARRVISLYFFLFFFFQGKDYVDI